MAKEQPKNRLPTELEQAGWRLEWRGSFSMWDVRAVNDEHQYATKWHFFVERRGLKYVTREASSMSGIDVDSGRLMEPDAAPQQAELLPEEVRPVTPVALPAELVASGWTLEWRTMFEVWTDVRAVRGDGQSTDWTSANTTDCQEWLVNAVERLEGAKVR